MRALRIALIVGASCHRELPATTVQLQALPAQHGVTATPGTAEESACAPPALEVVGIDERGALDKGRFEKALGDARAFAERCCTGDEAGNGTVTVTVAPQGYTTQVDIEPEPLATGPTGACVYASFHRVTTVSFTGEAATLAVPLRLRTTE